MKKIVSLLLICILMIGLLASCANASLAKKINKAADENDPMTYEEVLEALGKNVINETMETAGKRNGKLLVLRGVKNDIDYRGAVDKIMSGDSVRGIIVVIENDVAVKAVAGKLNKNSLK